jgi:hypothetical protein
LSAITPWIARRVRPLAFASNVFGRLKRKIRMTPFTGLPSTAVPMAAVPIRKRQAMPSGTHRHGKGSTGAHSSTAPITIAMRTIPRGQKQASDASRAVAPPAGRPGP